jgi:lipopolysaccharide/colanic/teichoic acid biosynthesis glycosyltransferase
MTFYLKRGKRAFDVFLVGVSAPLWLTLMLAVTIIIFFAQGRPVLFKQNRIGMSNRSFQLWKFRTMRKIEPGGRDGIGDVQRITKIGAYFRALGLDELPSIINILRGDLSLVGPRPLLPEYLGFYTDEELVRHTVRPGLTGLAQAIGRNGIDWSKRLAYDIDYVRKLSFFGDLKILMMTISTIFRKTGINESTDVTMERFDDWCLRTRKNGRNNLL